MQPSQAEFRHRVGGCRDGFDRLAGRGHVDDRAWLLPGDQRRSYLLGNEEQGTVEVEEVVVVLGGMLQERLRIVDA